MKGDPMDGNPIRRKEIMERKMLNEHMLYDAVKKVVHVVNETAYFIWERCDGQHTIEDIVREASSVSGTTEDIVRADVEQCMTLFREKGLLQV